MINIFKDDWLLNMIGWHVATDPYEEDQEEELDKLILELPEDNNITIKVIDERRK